MQVIKVEKDGIESEIPKELAKVIKNMDKQTFCMAYLQKDQFHQEITSGSMQDEYMKQQIDNYFEIEKKRRDMLEIGGNI